MARLAGGVIVRGDFNSIEDLITSVRQGSREFVGAMDVAAELLATTSQGLVQRYYRGQGPVGSEARRFRSTWGVPIRRITGKTYEGWKVRRRGMGVWELFNKERGAFMVEYGIVRGGHGVARKPLKRSAVGTLRFVQRTRLGNRIMAETFGNLRNNKGHFQSFNARMRGSTIIGMAGPTGQLP